MARFEPVKRFADAGLPLPTRGTADSAGYDFIVAEDIIIPSFRVEENLMKMYTEGDSTEPYTLTDIAAMTKSLKAKPTLVSTGMKCKLDKGQYLELVARSSTPLKHWLVVANAVGIIDADYYGNPDNDGEIFFQMINLSPVDIVLHKGDKIGQGIIKRYELVEDDNAEGTRLGGFGSTTRTDCWQDRIRK